MTPAERRFLLDSGVPVDSFDPVQQRAARASLSRRAEETRRDASSELTAGQVAELLGCTVPQVLEWADGRELYVVTTEDGLRFPEWQFPDGQRLLGLQPVLSELGDDMHPYSVEGLLADVPHEELGDKTAVEWLAGGGSLAPVVSLAMSSNYD